MTALEKKGVKALLKVLLVLVATALSTGFFGMALPFFALAMKILPGLGVGGVIYFVVGIAIGLPLGAVTSGVSLGRSDKLITRYYAVFCIALLALNAAVIVCAAVMQDRFAHV
jgi:hypothetical protein